MQVSVERLPGSLVVLKISVDTASVEKQVEVSYRKNASHVTVPGFRPGKAPRALIEERLNPELLLREAVDDLIESSFQQALKENELIPIEQAKLSDLKLEDDKSFSYQVTFTVEPEVTLGDYKGIAIDTTATKVTDDAVDEEVEKILDQASQYEDLTDSGIIKGDYVTVDYTMKLNGVEYPDGVTEGYPLEVGTDTFFTELNEGLLGAKVGDVVTVNTKYADDYGDPDLAGKDGEFAITIKSLRRRVRPELTDEWVEKLSSATLHTVEEFKERVQEHLQKQADESDRERIRTELVNKVVAAATVEIPEIMIEQEAEELMHDFEHRLSHNHLTLDDYADYQKTTVE
ncbi:MAG: trigger factor, partial [bacterium]